MDNIIIIEQCTSLNIEEISLINNVRREINYEISSARKIDLSVFDKVKNRRRIIRVYKDDDKKQINITISFECIRGPLNSDSRFRDNSRSRRDLRNGCTVFTRSRNTRPDDLCTSGALIAPG